MNASKGSVGFTAALLLAAGIAMGGCTLGSTGTNQSGEAPGGRAHRVPVSREFAVEGMDCQGCADTVTEALVKIPGVQSAKVSLDAKRAVVVADPSRVPAETIEAAVDKAGYKAKLLSAGSGKAE